MASLPTKSLNNASGSSARANKHGRRAGRAAGRPAIGASNAADAEHIGVAGGIVTAIMRRPAADAQVNAQANSAPVNAPVNAPAVDLASGSMAVTIQQSLRGFVMVTKNFTEFRHMLTGYVYKHKMRFTYSRDERVLITNDNKSFTGDNVTSAANGLVFQYPSCDILCRPLDYIYKSAPSNIRGYKSYRYSAIVQGTLLHCYKYDGAWKLATHGGYEVNHMYWNNTLTFQQAFEDACGESLDSWCDKVISGANVEDAVANAVASQSADAVHISADQIQVADVFHTVAVIVQHPLLHPFIKTKSVKLCAVLGDTKTVDYRVTKRIGDMKTLVRPQDLAGRETYGIILHGPVSYVVENAYGTRIRKAFVYHPKKIDHVHRNIYIALRAIRGGYSDSEFKALVEHVPVYFNNYVKCKYVIAWLVSQVLYHSRLSVDADPEPFIAELSEYFVKCEVNMVDIRSAGMHMNDILVNSLEMEDKLIEYIQKYSEVPK